MPIITRSDDSAKWTDGDSESLDLTHYSAGQLTTFQRCPRQYYYRYRKGMKMLPGGALILGKGVHHSVEKSLVNKFHKGELLGEDESADIAFCAVEKMLDSEPSELDNESPAELKDNAAVMASKWTRDIGPIRKPLSKKTAKKLEAKLPQPEESEKHDDRVAYEFTGIESFIRLELEGVSHPIVGWIDFIESGKGGSINIMDTKTGGQKKSPHDLRSNQMFTYNLAMKKAGAKVGDLGLDVIVKPKPRTPEGVTQVVLGPAANSEILTSLEQAYRYMDASNKAGNYPPRYSRDCSWCGYVRVCNNSAKTYVV